MSRVIKKTTSILLIIVLALSFMTIYAFAADSASGNGEIWDIVLVLDCSASLNTNDKDDIRYEAIESLLWSLNADYAEVGVVLFRANDSPGSDLRNGTKTFPISSIKSEHDRSRIMRQLRDDSGLPRHSDAQTDYYTALLVAQEMLHKRGNNRPGAIFLFTDDELSVLGSDANKAKNNLDTAIRGIRDDSILVCGVYLNASNKTTVSDKSVPVRDIVSMANEGSGRSLSDLYVEINDATQCYEPTDHFLHALGYDMLIEGGQIIRTTTPMRFDLPGIGIDKLAIRLSTQLVARDTQIKSVVKSVIFKDPSGHTFNGDSIRSFRGLYRDVYELTRSDVEGRGMKWAGEWTVTIEIRDGVDVGVVYDPVFTANVDVELEPAACSGLRAKTDLDLVARLAQASKPADYEGYTCTLELTSPDGSRQNVVLSYDAAVDGFPYTIPLTYGDYALTVGFACSLLERKDTQSWTVENLAPSLSKPLPDIRFSPLNPGSWTQSVDLEGYLTDEDSVQALRINLPNSGKGISLKGSTLQLKGLTLGSAQSVFGVDGNGQVPIEVTDTEGATALLMLNVFGGANALILPIVVAIAVLLLAVLIASILIIRRIVGNIPDGECSAEFQIINSNGRPAEICLSLPAPGTSSEVRRSTTLLQMLKAELNKGVIEGVNPNELEAVKAFVDENSVELSKVSVKCCRVSAHEKGKKRKISVPVIQFDGRKTVLHNNSVNLNIGETPVTLEYVREDEDSIDDSDITDYRDDFYDGRRNNGSYPARNTSSSIDADDDDF